MTSSTSTAVRFLFTGSKKSPQAILQLRLHVKPGASKNREGITAVTDGFVELCVAAQAKDGEANQAVIRVLSDTLGLPKSKFRLAQGTKSREKTVILQEVQGDGIEYASKILDMLHKASAVA